MSVEHDFAYVNATAGGTTSGPRSNQPQTSQQQQVRVVTTSTGQVSYIQPGQRILTTADRRQILYAARTTPGGQPVNQRIVQTIDPTRVRLANGQVVQRVVTQARQSPNIQQQQQQQQQATVTYIRRPVTSQYPVAGGATMRSILANGQQRIVQQVSNLRQPLPGAQHQIHQQQQQQVQRTQNVHTVNLPTLQQIQHQRQQQQQMQQVQSQQQVNVQTQHSMPVQQHQQMNVQHQQQNSMQQPAYYPPQQQQQPNQRQAIYHQTEGMNLAVPMREPTPTPMPEPVNEPTPEELAQSSTNDEPLPSADDGEIDIQIRNVVCNYTLPLHIDLKRLAMNSNNVTYDRGRGVMLKQKRNPNCYIKVYSSGKVYIVGCRSEVDCKKAARNVARHVQRVMGKSEARVCIRNYKVNNVLATCKMPFGIKIEELAEKYPTQSQYEPELSVGLIWRNTNPKATLRIHTTGSITVTGASSEAAVMESIEQIWPIVLEFRCAHRARGQPKRKRKAPSGGKPKAKQQKVEQFGTSGVIGNKVYFSDEEDIYDDDDLDFDE